MDGGRLHIIHMIRWTNEWISRPIPTYFRISLLAHVQNELLHLLKPFVKLQVQLMYHT
jgi:hypothetical protein